MLVHWLIIFLVSFSLKSPFQGVGGQENLKSPFQGVGGQEKSQSHQGVESQEKSQSHQGVGSQATEGEEISGQDSLTVYIFLLYECVISQFYTPQLSDFYKEYHDQKVGFIGYFPSFNDKPEDIKAFGDKYKLDFPLQQDYYKNWTKKMGATVTPEVAVWDHRSDRLIYRGRIDDSYVRVGKRKLHPQNHELKDIIENWLLNQTPDTLVQTQAIGCFISFNGPLDK